MLPQLNSPKWLFWKYAIHITLGILLIYAAYSVRKTPQKNVIHGRTVQYLPDSLVEKDTIAEPQAFVDPVEIQPEFPGGMEKLMAYLSKNIKYPSSALKNKIQGRVVVSFVVDTKGTISDVDVLRGIGYGCDEEAVRLVKNMPKWTPGTQNNTPVRWRLNLPVTFELNKTSLLPK